jgi:hypothetical protein
MASTYIKTDLVIVFKNTQRANAKIRMKVFSNKNIDHLIESLNNPRKKMVGIPNTAVILQVGVGTRFIGEYKQKYKL